MIRKYLRAVSIPLIGVGVLLESLLHVYRAFQSGYSLESSTLGCIMVLLYLILLKLDESFGETD